MALDRSDDVFVGYDYDKFLTAALCLTQKITVAFVKSVKNAENHADFMLHTVCPLSLSFISYLPSWYDVRDKNTSDISHVLR